jgi:hypothetical protein
MTELEVFTKSLNISRWTLVASIIVSTASIAFASLEMAFQRSHDVRSLRPLCEAKSSKKGSRVSIALRNVGLGPLIVTAVSLAIAEEEKPGEPLEPFVIPPLESRIVLMLSAAEAKGRELRLKVSYRDIYDKKYLRLVPVGPETE